jgi:hypothetical protein
MYEKASFFWDICSKFWDSTDKKYGSLVPFSKN